MSTVVVTGAGGQLGRVLCQSVWPEGITLVGLTRRELDVTDALAVGECIARIAPQIVVNAAAWTAVDAAESDPESAGAVNVLAPEILARACARRDTALIHVSSDFVFDGRLGRPYRESDPICPINVYGAGKAAGEERVRTHCARHVILRTAWLYGVYGRNFVKTILDRATQGAALFIVDDQYGSPTAAGDLAEVLRGICLRVIAARDRSLPWGTYHCANRGGTSWCGFARAILGAAYSRHRAAEITAVTTADVPRPARRPADSRLACTLLEQRWGFTLRPWEQALRAWLPRIALVTADCKGALEAGRGGR